MLWSSITIGFLCVYLAESRSLTNSTEVANYTPTIEGYIGSSCNDYDGCTNTVSCIHGVCSCAGYEYWVTDTCLKKKTINSTCTASSECVGKLACIKGECQCAEELYWNGTDCFIRYGFNSTCTSLFECKQSLQCYNSQCICCESDYWNGQFCAKKHSFDSRCNSSDQCVYTAQCRHGVCQCRNNEIWTGEICKTNACYSDDVCLNGGQCLPDKQSQSMGYECKCADGYLGHECQYSDGRATDFLIIFQTIWKSTFNPLILIPVNGRAVISIYSFSSNQNTSTVIINGKLEHSLGKVQTVHNGLHQAGFEIISNIPITLYTILYTNDPDGYLAIPIKYASTQYIIASFKVKVSESVFSLSPIYSRTVVNINLKLESGSITYEGQQYSNNDNVTIVINKYSVFELSHTSDLSGTMITASKPIAVVSGNTYNKINGISGVNPFIEMILPVDQLDVLYIIPHIAKRENSTVRLIAIEDTNVTKTVGNQYSKDTLKSRAYLDFFHSSISLVRSSNPIMVQIYPHELPSSQGDAFMMTIPGVNQYLNEYLFLAPSDYNSNISVTVETYGLDGFVLDGQYLTVPAVFSISGEYKKFSSFTLPIANGSHLLKHNRKVTFGLWVYGTGISSTDDSYGYPAGMAFKTT